MLVLGCPHAKEQARVTAAPSVMAMLACTLCRGSELCRLLSIEFLIAMSLTQQGPCPAKA